MVLFLQRVAEELGENLTDEELQAGFPTRRFFGRITQKGPIIFFFKGLVAFKRPFKSVAEFSQKWPKKMGPNI
jgi:hypothetical protein